jgi:CheY-like chemotaxis protein
VDEVNDGMEAIGLLDLYAPALDLVVLAYEMPLLNGLETLYALRTLQPGLKALLCIGLGEEVLPDVPLERVAFLTMPCTLQSLSEGLDKIYGIARHHLEHSRVAGSHRLKISGQLPHHPPR